MGAVRLALWSVAMLVVVAAQPTLTSAQLSDEGNAALELLKESMLTTLAQSSWRASMVARVVEVFEGETRVLVDEGVKVAQVVSARLDAPGEFDSYTKYVENGTANDMPFNITIEISNVGVSGDAVDDVYKDWIRFSAVSPPDILEALKVPIDEWVRIGSLDSGTKELFGPAALLQNPAFVFNASNIAEATIEVAEERDPDTVDGVDARVVFVKAFVNKVFLPLGVNITFLQGALGGEPPTVREEATFWIDAESLVILKSYGNVQVETSNVTLGGNSTAVYFDYNEPLMVPDSMTPLDETPGTDAPSG